MNLSPAEFSQWAAIIREETRPDDTGHDARQTLADMFDRRNYAHWDISSAFHQLWK